MKRVALALALVLTGCFYSDPINQRPSADIVSTSSAAIDRGDLVTLVGSANDPQGAAVTFRWRAYACGSDGTTPAGCDVEPFYETSEDAATFTVPDNRSDGDGTQSLRVVLEGTDELGAVTDPDPILVLNVGDHAPALTVRAVSGHGYVDDIPVQLYARWTDPDDGAAPIDIAWTIFSPVGGTYTLTSIAAPVDSDPNYLQQGQQLVPDGLGTWTARATATDPLGASVMQDLTLDVVADHPACIAEVDPIAAPTTTALPISDATLFSVLLVSDDLDVYPPQPSDPILGEATFAWSLLPPGGSVREPLDVTGNSVELDPARYSPGDIVELRVEIADRAHPLTDIQCVDTDPTCSESDDTCVQRLTWRVEIR